MTRERQEVERKIIRRIWMYAAISLASIFALYFIDVGFSIASALYGVSVFLLGLVAYWRVSGSSRLNPHFLLVAITMTFGLAVVSCIATIEGNLS